MASEASGWAWSSRTGGRHAVRQDAVQAGRGASIAAGAPDSDWTNAPDPLASRPARTRRPYLPLSIICAVQAALALPLVWSNTAFTDEADYLWIGRLVLAHWLHGKSWPAGYAHRVMSGSPVIYPPLGAVADNVAGLAGARILSLAFMLGATVLLYFTVSSLVGRTEAIIATALWAASETVYRLTFATYDPMSVFLVALSGWLAVEAGRRRRIGPLAASAAALALANAAAYSSIVIAPVVIAFAFLVWRPTVGARRSGYWAASFTAGWLALFSLLITVSGTWAGIAFTVLNRKVNDYQPPIFVLDHIGRYAGPMIVIALTGAAIAIRTEQGWRRCLLVVLGATALLVPVAQLYLQTAWALDKHVAFSIWFASIAAGYGCLRAGRWLARAVRTRPGAVASAGAVALFILLAVNWLQALQTLREWPNSTSFTAAFRPAAARTDRQIFASSQKRVAEYYTEQGSKWWLWQAKGLSLNPSGIQRSRWSSYYASRLSGGRYELIALFYAASRSVPRLSATARGALGGPVYSELLRLKNLTTSEPGVRALTRVLRRDRSYRLIAVGPYNGSDSNGVYAIWQRSAAQASAVADLP
jgi:hypothetical protein